MALQPCLQHTPRATLLSGGGLRVALAPAVVRARALARDRARARSLPHVHVSACVFRGVSAVGHLCAFACARARASLHESPVRVRVCHLCAFAYASACAVVLRELATGGVAAKRGGKGKRQIARFKPSRGIDPRTFRLLARRMLYHCTMKASRQLPNLPHMTAVVVLRVQQDAI